jgi:hypothetical protein
MTLTHLESFTIRGHSKIRVTQRGVMGFKSEKVFERKIRIH